MPKTSISLLSGANDLPARIPGLIMTCLPEAAAVEAPIARPGEKKPKGVSNLGRMGRPARCALGARDRRMVLVETGRRPP